MTILTPTHPVVFAAWALSQLEKYKAIGLGESVDSALTALHNNSLGRFYYMRTSYYDERLSLTPFRVRMEALRNCHSAILEKRLPDASLRDALPEPNADQVLPLIRRYFAQLANQITEGALWLVGKPVGIHWRSINAAISSALNSTNGEPCTIEAIASYRVVLDRPIKDLNFSTRTARCLEKMHIRYVGDLCTKTERDLLAIRHFGRKSLYEVKEALGWMELFLGMPLENWHPPLH